MSSSGWPACTTRMTIRPAGRGPGRSCWTTRRSPSSACTPPRKARLGDALDTPEQMVRGELRWALTHGMTERVRLLVGQHELVELLEPLTAPEEN
jgi:hypothetical protein